MANLPPQQPARPSGDSLGGAPPPGTVCDLTEIASLGREELLDRLMHFNGRVKLDFTAAFLSRKTTDQLRHILIAACKHAAQTDPPRRG